MQALQLVSVTAVCQWQLVAVPMSAASYQDPLPQQYWVNSVKYAPSSKAGQVPLACLLCKVTHSMYITYHCNTCVHYIVAITSEGTPKTLSSMSLRIHCNIAAGILYVVQVTMHAASVAAESALAASCSQHVQTMQLDRNVIAQTVCC